MPVALDSLRTRVVYADDDGDYRARLVGALLAEPSVDLVAVAVDRNAASHAVDAHRPDVVLVGDTLPGGPDVSAPQVMLVSSDPAQAGAGLRLRAVVDRALDPGHIGRLVGTLGASV